MFRHVLSMREVRKNTSDFLRLCVRAMNTGNEKSEQTFRLLKFPLHYPNTGVCNQEMRQCMVAYGKSYFMHQILHKLKSSIETEKEMFFHSFIFPLLDNNKPSQDQRLLSVTTSPLLCTIVNTYNRISK